jgi:hypothetical protein
VPLKSADRGRRPRQILEPFTWGKRQTFTDLTAIDSFAELNREFQVMSGRVEQSQHGVDPRVKRVGLDTTDG